jgi:argininosuccinate synthase
MSDRIVLAYSGGLDTSVTIRWLADQGYEVHAVAVDVGQREDFDAIADRAKRAGAAGVRVIEAVDRYADEFLSRAIKANALYEGKYPMVSGLARPCIAEEVVEVAREVEAVAVAHGCTGKGNDQWGIPVPTVASTYSVDENLWGRTAECGPLEDPWAAPPEEAFARTSPSGRRPAEPTEVVVRFEEGVPVALDGDTQRLRAIIARLDEVGGSYGFGRVDMIENRRVGIKSRELYEVPGALSLILAHRALEDLTLEREVAHTKPLLEARWADLVYDGQWFGPLRLAIDAFVDQTQAHVTGDVRLRYEPGACTVVGRKAESSLYDLSLATYGGDDAFDQSLAEGYVRLFGLPLRVWSAKQRP